ncbi:hypothetical protein GGU11DRAFT_758160 [Lentinula aff. detonsa]|nr:hypothetical protein GGU11DRAFT_758160 [Lentinula aff. detonsa]
MYLLLVTIAFTVVAKPVPRFIPVNGYHKIVASSPASSPASSHASVTIPSHGNQRLEIMLGRIAYVERDQGEMIRPKSSQGEFCYSETLPLAMQDEFVLFIGIENAFALNLRETSQTGPLDWELTPPRIMPPSNSANDLVHLEITVSFDSNERLKEVLDSFRDKAKVTQIAREVLQTDNVEMWNEAEYFDVILRYLVKIKAVDPKNNLKRWDILRARIDAVTEIHQLNHLLPNDASGYTLSVKGI